jgi:hypothetical protein
MSSIAFMNSARSSWLVAFSISSADPLSPAFINSVAVAWNSFRRCLSSGNSHATALERAGIRGLVEGQKVSFDAEEDRRTGKIAVANIKAA